MSGSLFRGVVVGSARQEGGPTIMEALRLSGLPFREARRLLATLLNVSDTWLLAHDDETLEPGVATRFFSWAERRRQGEPMAYLLGWREFFGHRFQVTPAVLIPRPETELLVECALELLPTEPQAKLLDLGTGSGAIAVSVALARPDAEVWATDVDAAALAVASQNAQALGAHVQLQLGSWWQALDQAAGARGIVFDVVVSNPPYVAAGDVHLQEGDLRYEPVSALTDHADGLSHVRTIVAGAPQRLKPGGWLCMEHGYDQAAALRAMLIKQGWEAVFSRRDLAGIERVTGGRWPA